MLPLSKSLASVARGYRYKQTIVTESVIDPTESTVVPPKPTSEAFVGINCALLIPIYWNAG